MNLSHPLRITLLHVLLFLPVFSQDYAWPTDASQLMTSSFCELRPRRYHAAIDIKTWGQSGYKIFALNDGYVYRLRVAATGYGKAIYLKLKDGNFALYAHLQGFTPEFEAYMDSLRLKSKRNAVDKRDLPPKLFPVKKGQHIGYTGETGIGVPHLHFEMRDRYNRPINPLQYYTDVIVDKIAPRPRSLAILPASARTLIDNAPDTLLMDLPGQKTLRINRPVHLSGPAFLALRSSDRADGAHNHFDFYRARMFVNDSLQYKVQYDRFSYDENHLVELDKNFALMQRGLKGFHNFYRHPGNSLPFYDDTPPGGGVLSGKNLQEGRNEVRIEIEDYFGNRMTLTLPVVYSRPQLLALEDVVISSDSLRFTVLSRDSLSAFRLSAVKPGSRTLRRVSFGQHYDAAMKHYVYQFRLPLPSAATAVRLDARRGAQAPILPVFVLPGDSLPAGKTARLIKMTAFGNILLVEGRGLPQRRGDWQTASGAVRQLDHARFLLRVPAGSTVLETPYGAAFDRAVLTAISEWTPVYPGKSRTIRSDDGRVTLRFPTNALHDTLQVRIRKASADFSLAAPYRYHSDIYEAAPYNRPFNHGAYVDFSAPDSVVAKKGVGLYYFDSRKGWSFLPADLDRNSGNFSTRVTSMERFVLIQDSIPPVIRPLNLQASATRSARFGVYDEFSGLFNERQIRVEVNGRWTMFTFDPEEDWVSVSSKYLPRGSSTITVTVRDNAGNQKKSNFSITRK